MRTMRPIRAAAVLAGLVLPGCAGLEPWQPPGEGDGCRNQLSSFTSAGDPFLPTRPVWTRPNLPGAAQPTLASALDAEMVAEVLQVMRDLVSDGMTMVVVSHELRFVRSAADRILFLAEGRIVEDRPAAEFLDNPLEERSRQFVAAIK